MRQRVAVARTWAADPDVILMDEPFAAVDAMTRLTLQEELARLCAATRKTVFFITHSVDEAVFLGDRVLVMTRRPGTSRPSSRCRAAVRAGATGKASPPIRRCKTLPSRCCGWCAPSAAPPTPMKNARPPRWPRHDDRDCTARVGAAAAVAGGAKRRRPPVEWRENPDSICRAGGRLVGHPRGRPVSRTRTGVAGAGLGHAGRAVLAWRTCRIHQHQHEHDRHCDRDLARDWRANRFPCRFQPLCGAGT